MDHSGANCSPVSSPQGDDEFLAAFVGGQASTRTPTTQLCGSAGEVRQWVECEAADVGLPVEPLSVAPERWRRLRISGVAGEDVRPANDRRQAALGGGLKRRSNSTETSISGD